MTANELRQKYLDFFRSKGHTIIPSASLVPENDPSVLFTTAGMHPLVPYLLGEKHPKGQRLVDVQKCVRTGDVDEVGDTYHHTFFEMLGNWSIGDPQDKDGIGPGGYWKNQAIKWSFEFLTSKQWLNIPIERIAVSVFEGDEDAPFDQESYDTWIGLGISEERIVKLPKKNNWWGQVLGPCGPNTEMFCWVEKEEAPRAFDHNNATWVEIWNDVFMEFNRKVKARDENDQPIDFYFEPLAQKNVDTGMGLERVLAFLNNVDDNYKTELFWPIIEKIAEISGKSYEENEKSFRIIADHLKASIFIIADGIVPANVGRGYVLRKLIRRAVRHGKAIGIGSNFTGRIAEVVTEIYKISYNELEKNKRQIIEELEKEENKFRKTLEKGLKEFEKLHSVTGSDAFNLYQTYGFPLEMTEELAREKGLEVNKQEFENEFQKHQDLSRTASAGAFKGGLADTSDATKKLHTAAHLMLAALRQVLGDHVAQKGSNITPERLRFDFAHGEKMTPEQIKKVEDMVNEQIQKNIPVVCEEISLDEAKAKGAMGVFDHKYGDKVKVYSVSDFSMEICGGPHVSNTSELGKFKIIKEEASSAGVRRIKAVLE